LQRTPLQHFQFAYSATLCKLAGHILPPSGLRFQIVTLQRSEGAACSGLILAGIRSPLAAPHPLPRAAINGNLQAPGPLLDVHVLHRVTRLRLYFA
jgi:hypothetical protein